MIGNDLADAAVEKTEEAGDKPHDNNNEKNDAAAIEEPVPAEEKQEPRHYSQEDEDRQRLWEEEQAKKTIIETAVKGKVKWYSVRDHYGFITRDGDDANDVFVHQTAISKSRMRMVHLRSLAPSEEVTFDVVQARSGLEAANVTGPDGAAVRGNPMVRNNMMRRRWVRRREQRGDDEVRRDAGERKERRRVPSLGSELEGLQLDDEHAGEGKGQKRRVRNARGTQRRRKNDEEKVEAQHEAKEDVKETEV